MDDIVLAAPSDKIDMIFKTFNDDHMTDLNLL